jgi:molybdopterin molybdotransferase
MKEVGNQMQFWQVAMKPGKPLAFGAMGGIPVFGLPGNPVSSMVSFEQFIRPSLLKMMGHKNLFRRAVRATLNDDIVKSKGARHFIRGSVTWAEGRYRVTTTGEQGSGILKSMVRANGLIVLPEDVGACKKVDEVTVQLLDLTPQPEYL